MFERVGRAIEAFEKRLRAGVELGPDFILPREMLEALLDARLVQRRGVGHEHQFEERPAPERAHMHHRLDRLAEHRRQRRLAIPDNATIRSRRNSGGRF